jgi:hypothetical protein
MGLAAVIFLSGRTMAPLNARRFAREYTIFKKSPRTTLAQDLRRAFPPPGRGRRRRGLIRQWHLMAEFYGQKSGRLKATLIVARDKFSVKVRGPRPASSHPIVRPVIAKCDFPPRGILRPQGGGASDTSTEGLRGFVNGSLYEQVAALTARSARNSLMRAPRLLSPLPPPPRRLLLPPLRRRKVPSARLERSRLARVFGFSRSTAKARLVPYDQSSGSQMYSFAVNLLDGSDERRR